MKLPWPILFLLGLAAGCDEPELSTASEAWAISEIALSVELRSNGNLAQVIVIPTAAQGQVVLELTGEDSLSLALPGGAEQRLTWFSSSYLGQMETGATEFEVVFQRGAERIRGALLLPDPFALSGPAGSVSRSDPIPVTWEAGPYTPRLEVRGLCLEWRSIYRDFSFDPGAYEIQPADLDVGVDETTCELVVQVSRSDNPSFALPGMSSSGHARTSQIRTITITTNP